MCFFYIDQANLPSIFIHSHKVSGILKFKVSNTLSLIPLFYFQLPLNSNIDYHRNVQTDDLFSGVSTGHFLCWEPASLLACLFMYSLEMIYLLRGSLCTLKPQGSATVLFLSTWTHHALLLLLAALPGISSSISSLVQTHPFLSVTFHFFSWSLTW